MSDILREPVTALSYFWSLERADGAGLALSSHDQSVSISGTRFRPAPGLLPAAVEHAGGLDISGGEIAGSLSSPAITERDLLAGRWDGARSHLFAADWTQPEAGTVTLRKGELGEVRIEGEKFSTDLIGAAERLQEPICSATSPECRAELGDRMCRVDLAGRARRGTVVSILGGRLVLDWPAVTRFVAGTLRWWSGENAGLSSVIVAMDTAAFVLRETPRLAVAVGDVVECHEGCDKRFATCRARFANAVNFQGEPHLPGNDLLTRYPGG